MQFARIINNMLFVAVGEALRLIFNLLLLFCKLFIIFSLDKEAF